MHHALTIPELIHKILLHVSPSVLAFGVNTVSKLWSDVSAEIIWYKLDDLRPLLRLIGEIKLNDHPERESDFSEICEFSSLYEDWSRFDFYSRHVRVLSLGGSVIDFQPALNDVAMLRSGKVFLPRLKELEWSNCERDSWKSSVFMMHEGITTFLLYIPWDLYKDGHTHMVQYFSFIAARLPCLEYLHIDTMRHRDPNISQLGSALELLVSKLTSLKTIRFPPFVNTFSILSATSTLPHITTIFVEDSSSYPVHTPLLPSGLPCTLPSQLGTLHVSMAFKDATRLFHTDLPNLLDIFLQSGQCEAPPTVHRLTKVISQSCHNVRELQLNSQGASQGFTGNIPDCIAIADIAPLFSCSAMEEFTIEHAFPLLLSNPDIQTLLTKWPALKVLNLNSCPLSLPPREINLPLPEWKTLATFAWYGSNLRTLGLYMNGLVDIPNNKDAYPFARLDQLYVGTSEIRGTHNEARFLSYILPSGCTIIPTPVGATYVTWNRIVPFVSAFQEVREEEREARKELEGRVMELEALLAS
ncbi:uncharacterized protein EV420DRAFT_817267 [Desarmillaria tabescens]|uniref:F-box domain-containing protein n=1 Tax=Armillaria tabescens TaxID=1929756 RepID=A0AA39NIF7_ARMTA|nr:uncharacterized protein EV420DRAFT_817267 [Desarmillaria tabescens]KAK0466236.1 hypothetical protein EV420DRAFT_817267 [Desarmillaria tabescens]